MSHGILIQFKMTISGTSTKKANKKKVPTILKRPKNAINHKVQKDTKKAKIFQKSEEKYQ